MRILARTEFTELNTGYAIYMKAILSSLHNRGHEIAELASGISPEFVDINRCKWKVYPNIPSVSDTSARSQYEQFPGAEFGAWQFENVLLNFKPDVVIDISDVWHYEYQLRSPLRKYYAHVAGIPVDAEPQSRHWIDIYNKSDAVIGYCNWGLNLVKEAGCTKGFGVAMPFASPAHRMLDNRDELKRNIGFGDIKIIGMVGRNQKRKLFPNLFKSFADYLKESGRNDVYLYVHSYYPERCYDFDIDSIKLGIQNKVLYSYVCGYSNASGQKCGYIEPSLFKGSITFCPHCGNQTLMMANVQIGYTPEQMNLVYNMFDLYAQVATNEGYCLPLMEAGASGTPVVSTDYSSMSDVARLLNGRMIPPLELSLEAETGRKMAVADNRKLTDYFHEFFDLPESVRLARRRNTRRLYEKNWNIDSICKTWIDAIESVKPERAWNSPLLLKEPQRPPEGLSNAHFARWLIVNVLQMPELAGSLMETRLIRDLNMGVTPGAFGGEYFHEITAILTNHKYQKFGRDEAMRCILNSVDKYNFWEQRRVNSLT